MGFPPGSFVKTQKRDLGWFINSLIIFTGFFCTNSVIQPFELWRQNLNIMDRSLHNKHESQTAITQWLLHEQYSSLALVCNGLILWKRGESWEPKRSKTAGRLFKFKVPAQSWTFLSFQVAIMVANEFWEQGDLERTVLQQQPIVSTLLPCIVLFSALKISPWLCF